MKKFITRIFRSMVGKILLISITCMVIPMLISLFYASMKASHSLESEVNNTLSSIAMEKKDKFEIVFSDLSKEAVNIANNPYVVEYFRDLKNTGKSDKSKEKIISTYLEGVSKEANGIYENIFYAYDGKIYIDGTGGKSIGHVFEDATEPWYKEVLQNKVYIGNAWPSPVTGRPTNVVAAPVIDNITGEVLTAFAAPVELNTLGERILKDNSNSKVKSFVIDSSGQVISSDDISQILKLNLSSEKGNIKTFYNQLKNKKSGKGHFTLKNTNYIAAYAKCENQDMCIISYMPVNAYMSKINELKTGLAFVILVGILISAIVIIVLSFRTVKPITLAAEFLKTVANGDFSKEVPVKYQKNKDETGILMTSLETMQISIKDMIKTIKEESSKLDGTVTILNNNISELNSKMEDVSATTEEMSAGMEETAAFTQEMNASSELLETSVTSIAQKAQEGATTSKEIRHRAESLKESANQSQKSALDISDNVKQDMMKAIEQSKAVDQINLLTESILQIAGQTNLLALNASIEAARAGETGKGFAVVADEIRSLADASKNAVTEIQAVTKSVISSVNNLTDNSKKVIDFIDNSVLNDYKFMVETGEQYYKDAEYVLNLVNDFSKTCNQLDESIENMVKSISQISIANNEAAQGIEIITHSTTDVSLRTSDVAKVSEETTESVKKLKNIVTQFRI